MANVNLNTVRAGVRLLSAVMKESDNLGRTDGKVSKRDIENLKDSFGDGGALDKALDKVYRYTAAKTDKASPTIKDVNTALADAMKAIAKGDKNKDSNLDTRESRQLAETWKAIVDFSKEYRGYGINDIVMPGE
mgnify:CR=1 FL=1|jgi:hypothetical protein